MEHAWTEVDLEALSDNLRQMQAALASRSELIFIVKADAYGHGMIPVACRAAECGVKWFGVAHMDEATALKSRLPGADILIMGAIAREDVPEAVSLGLIPVVVDEEHALALAGEAAAGNMSLRCHVKVDTGMGRLGIVWDRAAAVIENLSKTRGLSLTGICSHFSSSDAPDAGLSKIQAGRFAGVVEECGRRGIRFPFRHISNTGGFHTMPECDFEGVRCGIELYGYGRRDAGGRAAGRPLLQWKSRVVQVKKVPAGFTVGYGGTFTTRTETHIGTIDAGYSDGYPRVLGNRAWILVGGRRVPVVGRVSMNLTTVDLGPDTDAKAGDEAVLIGSQGGASIWADEIARWCGTIPYEVLTNIHNAARYTVSHGRFTKV